MSTAKKLEENQELKTGHGCSATVPETPSESELAEARAALGLTKTPKYRLAEKRLRKLNEKWDDEPIAINGV